MSNRNANYNQRYFVDEGYDRKVYENDWKNILVIIGVFMVLYALNIIWFWGDVSLAMANSEGSMWFNVGIFIYTIAFFVAYLIYGKRSNNRRELSEFYKLKIILK